jgi:predicted transcriptional regulator
MVVFYRELLTDIEKNKSMSKDITKVKPKGYSKIIEKLEGKNRDKKFHHNFTTISPRFHHSFTITQLSIIEEITNNRNITIKEIAEKIDVTERTIKYNIKKLKEAGVIKRVGSNIGGYWQVIE